MWIEVIVRVFIGILLFVMSFEDIRRRSLSVRGIMLLYLVAVAGVILEILLSSDADTAMRVAGGGIGGILLLFARGSHEQIGYGDGLVVLAIGVYMGFMSTLLLLFLALILAMFFSAVMLVGQRFHFRTRVPFLPFLTLAYVPLSILGYGR